jgi:hypothetical protein
VVTFAITVVLGRSIRPVTKCHAAAFALACMATPGFVQANPSARLIYARTPEASSCPDEATLRSAVAARLGYDPFFPWAMQTMVVQVWRQTGQYHARLQLVDGQGLAHGTRTLTSGQATCAELFDTTALAISIAMNALATKEPDAETPAPAPPEPPPPVPQAAPPPLANPPEQAASASPLAAPSPEPPRRRGYGEVGVDGLGALGVEPAPTVGLAAFGGVVAPPASLSLEVRADAPSSANSAAGGGHVRAWSYALTLAPCARWGPVSLCVLGSVGILSVSGQDITEPRSARAVFATVGGRVGAEWPASAAIALRAHVDADIDLRRATPQIDGDDAWTAPIVSVIVGAGVAAHFD